MRIINCWSDRFGCSFFCESWVFSLCCTKKHYDYYRSLNYKMIFMIGGQIMREGFNLNELDYSSLNNVAIIRIIDSYDKIIFMMSIKAK